MSDDGPEDWSNMKITCTERLPKEIHIWKQIGVINKNGVETMVLQDTGEVIKVGDDA